MEIYKTANMCTTHYVHKFYFQESRIAYSFRNKPRRNYQELTDVKLL